MRRPIFFKASATLLGILLVVGLVGLNSAQASIANPDIAYDTGVQTGNQDFGGSLGMDFNVITPIVIDRLGVFDSGADGISGTLYVTIFDRNTKAIVPGMPTLSFSGNDGTLINGSRFKAAGDVPLGVGDYSIVAWGYSPSEPNGNYYLNTHTGGTGTINLSTLDTFGGRISFVGTSRYSLTAGNYPATVDFGPANQYLAGTFAVPLPPTALLLGSGLLGLGLAGFRKKA